MDQYTFKEQKCLEKGESGAAAVILLHPAILPRVLQGKVLSRRAAPNLSPSVKNGPVILEMRKEGHRS